MPLRVYFTQIYIYIYIMKEEMILYTHKHSITTYHDHLVRKTFVDSINFIYPATVQY